MFSFVIFRELSQDIGWKTFVLGQPGCAQPETHPIAGNATRELRHSENAASPNEGDLGKSS
jgi:hypothetical protein